MRENENLMRKILEGNEECGMGRLEEGKGKSPYFIQTFEHSNIRTFKHSNILTFLTSYLPLRGFRGSDPNGGVGVVE